MEGGRGAGGERLLTSGTQHQLEFHACFEEYLEHFEGKIKRFIESTGEGTVEDFYEECR